MSKIKYDKKLEVYYKDDNDYNWLKNQHNNYFKENKRLNKKSVFKWKKKLIQFFHKPYNNFTNLSKNKVPNNDEKLCQSLNISRFKEHDWDKLEDWKIQILYQTDEYLMKNNLIRSKRISVQFLGSLGSFNPIPYSDFDCLIILPLIYRLGIKEIYEIKKLYKFLNFQAHIFDPLQHHDIFIITEDELFSDIPSLYPLKLLNNTWGYGRDHFYCLKNTDNKITSINFVNNNQYLRRLDYNQEPQNTLYQLKYTLSSIYLMPAYFYNAKNEIFSKRSSINKIINRIPNIKKKFNWLTEFRNRWPSVAYPYLKKNVMMYGINVFSQNNMIYFYRKIDYFLNNKRIKHPFLNHSLKIVREARIISDFLLESIIKKDGKRKPKY